MAVRKTVKAEKTASRKIKCCLCEHSHLVRYDANDPVLAECMARKVLTAKQDGTCRYRHPVEVASVERYCELFDEAKSEKTIESKAKRRRV